MAFENTQYIETLDILDTIETIWKSVSTIGAYEFRCCNSLKSFVTKEKTVRGYHVINDVLFKETRIIHYPVKKTTTVVHPYALQEWDYWIYHYIRLNHVIEKVIHSKIVQNEMNSIIY